MSTPEGGPVPSVDKRLLRATDVAARGYFRLQDVEGQLADANAELLSLRESVSFRLGAALVSALKSWRGLAQLPNRLVSIARGSRAMDVSSPRPVTAAASLAIDWPLAERQAYQGQEICAPATLKELRIAAVLDQFSEAVLAPECNLANLPAEGFEAILDELAPHMLFVESAWRGLGGSWHGRLTTISGDLLYLLDCCRRRGIPTVFWNKEDPAHFGHFLDTAKLFDYVFTTDSDCVPRYAEAIGHLRIDALPFACQPTLHNPLEKVDRKLGACFAGSWYESYPERCEAFEALVSQVSSVMPVAIYDRNHGRNDPCFAFPERYGSMMHAGVAYREIADVYKAYEYAITINSVETSPTMVARRVYELLACSCVVATNPTAGMSQSFRGIVVGADAGEQVAAELARLIERPIERDRKRLKGLRLVMSAHTASHRLSQVCAKVLGIGLAPVGSPRVLLAARVRTLSQAIAVRRAFLCQTWSNKRLLILLADGISDLGEDKLAGAAIVEQGGHFDFEGPDVPSWLAILHPDDHYGAHYIEDLMVATQYASEQMRIGKGHRFRMQHAACIESADTQAYRLDAVLSRRSMMQRWENGATWTELVAHIDRMEDEEEPEVRGLVVDGFEYCRDGAGSAPGFVDV